MGWNRGWTFPAYVSVSEKLSKATEKAKAIAKKQGRLPSPVKPEGRKISNTFWGKGWCDHLGGMSDFATRLQRGATYLRNGSVVDLVIKPGRVDSIVAGSEPYDVEIEIDRLHQESFEALKKRCTGSIRSLIDLLAGKLEESVIKHLTHAETGMFPKAQQIRMKCSCPDFASVCKHIAAVFYAIGCKLDHQPELLFVLRDVDHAQLVGIEALAPTLESDPLLQGADSLGDADLGALFGIDLDGSGAAVELPAKGKSGSAIKKKTTPKTKKPTASDRNAVARKVQVDKVLKNFAAAKPDKALAPIKPVPPKRPAEPKSANPDPYAKKKSGAGSVLAGPGSALNRSALKRSAPKKAKASTSVRRETPKTRTARPTPAKPLVSRPKTVVASKKAR